MNGAVLFDMDGTIVDREPLAAQALVDACATADWVLDDRQLDQLFGRAWQDVYRELDVAARTGWSEDRFVSMVIEGAEQLAAGGYPVPALAGAMDLIQTLDDHDVPLALGDRFDPSRGRRDAGPARPARSLRRGRDGGRLPPGEAGSGCIRARAPSAGCAPNRSVAIEDSWAGVTAARAAGLRVVGTRGAHLAGRVQPSGSLRRRSRRTRIDASRLARLGRGRSHGIVATRLRLSWLLIPTGVLRSNGLGASPPKERTHHGHGRSRSRELREHGC